jgi:hypothetical protein
MTTKRAEDRKFHFTYKVTCLKTKKVFYGLHSTDELDPQFEGKGTSLYMSFKNHGRDVHKLEQLQTYPSRAEAKIGYNELKASQLANPRQPENYKFHFVYKTTSFDGKYYIGVHSTDDLDDGYKGSGTHIIRSLKRYGWDKHDREVLHLCGTRDLAFDKEKEVVTKELLKDPLCMNFITGGRQHGNRVYGVTAETKQKISENSKAMWDKKKAEGYVHPKQSTASIAKRVAKNTGKKRTPEQLTNLSQGQQGYYSIVDKAILQERGARGLRTRIENGTDKMGGRPKGIPMSDEQKARQSAQSKGKIFSEAHKLALRVPKLRACCIHCRAEAAITALSRHHQNCS